jgi:hypothetical protein
VIPGLDPKAHNYWYDNPWISSDVIMLLTSGFRPDQRELVGSLKTGQAQIWHFPNNYEERIQEPLKQLRKYWYTAIDAG